jgi:hypothetical protein
MTTQWEINPGVQRVELKDGQAEVKFDVRNPGPVDDRATVDVVGSEQADASWFTVPEPQRTVPHGGSVTFGAVVKPGEKAPPGTHWFAGRVYSADTAPEENSVTSDRVTFEIKPPAEKPKPKWWLWALIGGGLVVVVLGVVLFLLLSGGPEVPLVEGMTEAEATALIEDEGLVAVVEKQGHATVDKGRVISQDPRAGSAAEDGATVTMKVSTGPKFVSIPTIAGHFDAVQGVLELQNAGLDVKVVLRTSNDVPRDEVIGTDPPAQSTVIEGSEVKLLVSSGPIKIPIGKLEICVKRPDICELVKKGP